MHICTRSAIRIWETLRAVQRLPARNSSLHKFNTMWCCSNWLKLSGWCILHSRLSALPDNLVSSDQLSKSSIQVVIYKCWCSPAPSRSTLSPELDITGNCHYFSQCLDHWTVRGMMTGEHSTRSAVTACGPLGKVDRVQCAINTSTLANCWVNVDLSCYRQVNHLSRTGLCLLM